MEHESDNDINCKWCAQSDPQRLIGVGNVWNRKTSRYQLKYSIFKIGQNAAKSSGDLRRLAVSSRRPSAKAGGKNLLLLLLLLLYIMRVFHTSLHEPNGPSFPPNHANTWISFVPVYFFRLLYFHLCSHITYIFYSFVYYQFLLWHN